MVPALEEIACSMIVRSIVLPAGERGGGCSSWKSRCYWIGGSSCALVRGISVAKGNEVDRASGIFRPAMAQYLSELDSLAFGRLAQRERRCLTSTRSGVQIPHRPPDFQARALSWPFCFLLRFGDDGGSGAWLAFEGGRCCRIASCCRCVGCVLPNRALLPLRRSPPSPAAVISGVVATRLPWPSPAAAKADGVTTLLLSPSPACVCPGQRSAPLKGTQRSSNLSPTIENTTRIRTKSSLTNEKQVGAFASPFGAGRGPNNFA